MSSGGNNIRPVGGLPGAVLFVFLRVGSEPTALVAAWFSFTTVELWALSGITKTKITQGGGEGQWKP
jgi:hypothetical protein